VRLRVAGRVASQADAVRIGNEVETLYTNGPAGGGGVGKSVREVVAIASVLIPEDIVRPQIEWHVA
ncbi:acyclic terpene utilization AtuA family protein, partial [Acinetobacter baumannii]|uniref:acyclic terpene utilization AtuA family protein n=1 Tax=Acinetobacter baumannii TaxID=470 RepID=UPI003F67592C